jgi:hypothetical protein
MKRDYDRRLGDSTIINDYPVAMVARFFSCSSPSAFKVDPTYIANTPDGMWAEMERIGIARATPDEIPDELIPVSNLNELYNARRGAGIVLERVEFSVYDVKRTAAPLSSGIQVADVNTAITASIATTNNIYIQSTGLNAIPIDWNPNWFNPRVTVNGRNIEGTIGNTFHPNHAGLNSLGGYTGQTRDYAIYFDSIQSLSVNARCAQRIRTAGGDVYYQPYAVMATITFRIHW